MPLAAQLDELVYHLLATRGTAERLEAAGVRVERIKKIRHGHPNLLDYNARR